MTDNDEYGVECRTGGYARGEIGALDGSQGLKNIDSSCIDGLS